MSWITEDWRLKLLAVGLAVLMLGAVAFSQNPPTTKTLNVRLGYHLPPNSNIIITNGPSKIPVTINGLADAISTVGPDNVFAFADATHASPGPNVKLNVIAQANGVTVTQPQPISVNIDQLKTFDLPVSISYRAAPGWTVDKVVPVCAPNPTPCHVHFSGPASWGPGLQASVNYTTIINFNSNESGNWPVALSNSAGGINLSQTTYPALSLDFYNVTVQVQAHFGSTSRTVALVAAAPAQPPPAQYEITGVSISPATAIISGDPAVLGNIQSITLPAIDLSGARSTTTVKVSVPYPDNVSGNVVQAQVTYTIQRNPTVTPSP